MGLQDGGFLLTGWTESMGSGGLDGWVLRLSPQGNPLWQRTFGEGGNDSLHSTVVTPNGEFLVTGSTASVGSGEMDGWALRLGPQGNPLWQSTFGGSSRDRINSALMLPDGGYLLSGETFSMGSGGFDGWTIRLNQQGQLLWQRTFGGGKNDSFNSSISLPDGGFLLAGWTASMGSGAADGWVVRINGEGQLP